MTVKNIAESYFYKSLGAMFLAQAERHRGKVLYRHFSAGHWRSLTWGEALGRIREIALGLVSLGISRGDRIAILSANRLEWLLADWANISIGALTVPIFASSSPAQANHIIGHAGPALLIVDSMKRFEKLDLSRASLNELKAIVAFDGDREAAGVDLPAKVIGMDDLAAIGRKYADRHGGVFELLVESLRPEDDLTIIYTSGTTGTPKGAVTTHGHYLFMIQAVDAAVPSTDGDVTLHFLPTAHALGRLEHFMAAAKGWTLAIARSIETIARDLRSIRPTVIFSVPRIYENAYQRIQLRLGRQSRWRRQLFDWGLAIAKERLKGEAAKELDWRSSLAFAFVRGVIFARVRAGFGSRMRLAICGGAPLDPEISRFFHALGIPILEGYGLTETSTVSHVNRPENIKHGTVGLPLAGTECRIAEDGEILLRGPHIFKAYHRDLFATDEAIDAQGWFHTGDIGLLDADGFLRITDRKKDLIVTSGGKKVAPQKLESLLQSNPLIHQALVVGRGQAHLIALLTVDRKRCAELAKEQGVAIDGKELAAHPWVHERVREIIHGVNKHLAPFEAIRDFAVLDHDFTIETEELTPTLKTRRRVIEERYKDLIADLYGKGIGDRFQ
ncbi:MAG TPA: long-chain fatty acid--CoA ligase [Verrucomicrobiae bacterium]|nr:long-chain fatty acid--CoA ligase [Verrucomicrobiae bacterium]